MLTIRMIFLWLVSTVNSKILLWIYRSDDVTYSRVWFFFLDFLLFLFFFEEQSSNFLDNFKTQLVTSSAISDVIYLLISGFSSDRSKISSLWSLRSTCCCSWIWKLRSRSGNRKRLPFLTALLRWTTAPSGGVPLASVGFHQY